MNQSKSIKSLKNLYLFISVHFSENCMVEKESFES